MAPHSDQSGIRIDWARAAGIFGNPKPPEQVWERQFDTFDDELTRLARTPYGEIDFADLWYYFHDLAHVDLQQDLFNYLFPVCLMDWHLSLLRNENCGHGDSEFHYAVHHGQIFDKMMTPGRREEVFKFFRDSFLERLDLERGFAYSGAGTPAYAWLRRFNALSVVAPVTEAIWTRWWSLETPGRAVAALQYCSDLIYGSGRNPLFPAWTPEIGGGGPNIFSNCGWLHDAGWMEANLRFLGRTLTLEFVKQKVAECERRLRDEPEHETARRILEDLPAAEALIVARIPQLPYLLAETEPIFEWLI